MSPPAWVVTGTAGERLPATVAWIVQRFYFGVHGDNHKSYITVVQRGETVRTKLEKQNRRHPLTHLHRSSPLRVPSAETLPG